VVWRRACWRGGRNKEWGVVVGYKEEEEWKERVKESFDVRILSD
jgi:hypothetical protein